MNRPTIVTIVGGLFFPRVAELGLAVEDTVSPRVLAKMIHAGTMTESHVAASRALLYLANLSISSERVRRACQRIAEERAEHHQRMQQAFEKKSLPEQTEGKPEGVEVPEIACIMGDGGRLQLLDRSLPNTEPCSAEKGDHWKESRIAAIMGMSGQEYDCDPQPTLPPELCYNTIAETLSEIGHTGKTGDLPQETQENGGDYSDIARCGEGIVGPELEHRSVVASRKNWEEFGRLLVCLAWYKGFAAAKRKVFVSDGSAAIEKMQRTHFSHYTSVLDLLHGLAYSLAAARAMTQTETAARDLYNAWAAKIWEGKISEVIDELRAWSVKLGPPPEKARSDDPRLVVRTSLVFYENHACRMDYPNYRRAGFSLTSSLMESTVKQVNRRVKGSEKFWSSSGGEAMLRLRGEAISDDHPLRKHLESRTRHATGQRSYRSRNNLLSI